MAVPTPIAYYKLDGNANDAIGSNNLTNNNSVTFSAGKIGSAADFGTANTDKSLTLASNLGIAGHSALTIAGWAKMRTEISTGQQQFFGHADSGGSEYCDMRYDYNAGTRRVIISTNFSAIAASNLTMGTSDWYHFALTRGASYNYTLYVNGSSVNTGTGGSNFTGSTGVAIGRTAEASSLFASAYIDEVGFWNSELDSTNIGLLYNSGNGITFGGSKPLFFAQY